MKEVITAVVLSEPLSDRTKRNRALLLSISLLIVLIAQFGLTISEAGYLAFKFKDVTRGTVTATLIIVLSFLFIDFILNFCTDIVIRVHDVVKSLKENLSSAASPESTEVLLARAKAHMAYNWIKNYSKLAYFIAFIRLAFDFIAPLVLAVYAFIVTIRCDVCW